MNKKSNIDFEIEKKDDLEIVLVPKNDEFMDFSENSLSFNASHAGKSTMQLSIRFIMPGNFIEKEVDATFLATLPANKKQKVFTANALNNASMGMLGNPPSEIGTLACVGWGSPEKFWDFKKVKKIIISINDNDGKIALCIEDVIATTEKFDYKTAYKNITDEYGQYTISNAKNKIKCDKDLVDRKNAEAVVLDEFMKNYEKLPLSKYGSPLNEELRQESKGHFYTKKVNGKWFLVDPDGYLFLSSGIDILRLGDSETIISGREFMFESLPDKEKFASHFSNTGKRKRMPMDLDSGEAYRPYNVNLEKKYGDDYKKKWLDTTIKRLKSWGYTSTGNWCDPEYFYGNGEKFKLPYFAHIWTAHGGDFAKVESGGYWDRLPDPFDPLFKENVDKQIKIQVADYPVDNDPWCVGIFIDNEIPWGDCRNENGHYSIIRGIMTQDACDKYVFAKKEMVKILQEKYDSISDANKAWNTNFSSWEDVNKPCFFDLPKEDSSCCLTHFIDGYYSVIRTCFDKYFKNKLYLGTRIAEWGAGPELTKVCAKYADVVSFNCYHLDVNRNFFYYDLFDKPTIIGEFHFTAADANCFTPGLVPVADQKEKGEHIYDYIKSVFLNEKMVGVHWFQYYDQPTLGRSLDGENSNCGIVDITDTPHNDALIGIKKINSEIYNIKLNG